MIALTITLTLLLPFLFAAGIYGGLYLANLKTPQLGKLREDNKRLRKENEKIQKDLNWKTWLESDRDYFQKQIERYKAAAESHQLKPAAEFFTVPFKESFCGNGPRLEETIKSTLTGIVQEAKASIYVPDTFESIHENISVSGSPTKIGGDIRAFLIGKSMEGTSAQVTITGTYRKLYVEPPVQFVTVIETIKEPVIVPVPQNLPFEVQEFLDRYPEGERLKLLETAAEFKLLEK